jgi:hypothetical protein
MKNLETMGVQEMNASEMKEENGGFNIVDALIMCALANIVAGFQDGANAHKATIQ